MKVAKNILRVLTLVLSVGALALFFFNFATFVTGAGSGVATGATLAFGSKIKIAGETVNLAKSSKLLFTMLLALIGAVCAGLSFRFKKSSFFQVGFTLGGAIYLLVYYIRGLSDPRVYIDPRPVAGLQSVSVSPLVLVLVIVLFAAAVFGIAYTLVADYVDCKGKMTIPRRIVRFFREYKSEIKKIVWPGPRSVVKNTLAVLIMCLVLGAFIWLLDFGLSSLVNWILSL